MSYSQNKHVSLDKKIEGGKLLRIQMICQDNIIIQVRVDGDFFAYPEELFEEAESGMCPCQKDEVISRAQRSFSTEGLSIFGANPIQIAQALAECAGQE